jgi:hypothetical protein
MEDNQVILVFEDGADHAPWSHVKGIQIKADRGIEEFSLSDIRQAAVRLGAANALNEAFRSGECRDATIRNLRKEAAQYRAIIKSKDDEIARLNAEIDRIVKESRYPVRHCCHIPCNKEAIYTVYFGEGSEDYTEVCADHLAETIRDVEVYTVYPVQDPGEKGGQKLSDKEIAEDYKWLNNPNTPVHFCYPLLCAGCLSALQAPNICPYVLKVMVDPGYSECPQKWTAPQEEGKEPSLLKRAAKACAELADEFKDDPVVFPQSQHIHSDVATAEDIPVLYVKITNPSGDDVKEAGEVLKHMRANIEIVSTNLRPCPEGCNKALLDTLAELREQHESDESWINAMKEENSRYLNEIISLREEKRKRDKTEAE